MEKLQLFDINRCMLNESVDRDKKLDLPDGKYFMIVLIFIQNSFGDFLIQKTSASRDSVYATCGGHVSFGDDSIITVLKEAREEMGVSLNKDDVILVDSVRFDHCYCDVYYCKKDIDIDNLVLQCEEVDSVSWMSIDEINSLISSGMFRKGNIIPFNNVLKYIRNR